MLTSFKYIYLNITWLNEHLQEDVTWSLKFGPYSATSSALPSVWLLTFLEVLIFIFKESILLMHRKNAVFWTDDWILIWHAVGSGVRKRWHVHHCAYWDLILKHAEAFCASTAVVLYWPCFSVPLPDPSAFPLQIENASEVLITPLEKFRKEQIGAAKVRISQALFLDFRAGGLENTTPSSEDLSPPFSGNPGQISLEPSSSVLHKCLK